MGKDFHTIFERLLGKLDQEYDATNGVKPAGPEYKPSKPAGPQPLSIEEYKRRTNKPKPVPIPTPAKKKSRGGKKNKLRQKRTELRRLIGLSSGEQMQKFYKE